MNRLPDCLGVLTQYPGDFHPEQIELLGSAGGFSGARIWRVKTPDRAFCLKSWPSEAPTEESLRFIHSVLGHVSRSGLSVVPVPCTDRLGRSVVRFHDELWELAPWMPGRADFWQDPVASKLEAALRTLAEFHGAAATLADHAPRLGRSPGIRQRLEKTRRYLAGDLEELFARILPDVWPEFCERARKAVIEARAGLGPLEVLLETANVWEVPLQICIRDVWHDHVLFTEDRVTGLVDFDAVGIESVAADVTRLLSSLSEKVPACRLGLRPDRSDGRVGDPTYNSNSDAELRNECGETTPKDLSRSIWLTGLAAYESIRPLLDRERALVEVFERSAALLGPLNWIEWLYRERREFRDPAAVARRFDSVLTRWERQNCGLAPGILTRANGGFWME